MFIRKVSIFCKKLGNYQISKNIHFYIAFFVFSENSGLVQEGHMQFFYKIVTINIKNCDPPLNS